jgi:hypothetical protein
LGLTITADSTPSSGFSKWVSSVKKGAGKIFLPIETLGSTLFGDFCGAGSAGTSQKYA